MKQRRQAFEKITKYSIRKLSVGVGPVAIGALLFAGSVVGAPSVQADQFTVEATVHMGYVTENELTPEEQAQVIRAIPEEYQNEDTFYLVYKKKTPSQGLLPQTGTTELAIAGLSIATASLAVLLLSKKHRKKVMGLLLIGSMGQSLLLSIDAAALQNIELASYNQTLSIASSKELVNGVIPIEGYDYVGYLRCPVDPRATGQEPHVKVEEKPVSQPAIEGKTLSQVTPEEGPAFPIVDKPNVEVSTEIIPFETVEQADPTLAKGQTAVLRAGQNGEQTVFTEVSTVNGQEIRKVVESKVTKEPVSQILAVGTKEDVQPSPQPAPVVTAKGTQEEGHVGEAPIQPEAPAYTGVVEAKGTQEEGHVGEAPVQPETPAYTGDEETKGTH